MDDGGLAAVGLTTALTSPIITPTMSSSTTIAPASFDFDQIHVAHGWTDCIDWQDLMNRVHARRISDAEMAQLVNPILNR